MEFIQMVAKLRGRAPMSGEFYVQSLPRSVREQYMKGNRKLSVSVRGLPCTTVDADLEKHFEDCGEVATFRVPKNEEGQCKGIATIKYKSQEGVDKALKFDSTDYGGSTIYVAKIQKRSGGRKPRTSAQKARRKVLRAKAAQKSGPLYEATKGNNINIEALEEEVRVLKRILSDKAEFLKQLKQKAAKEDEPAAKKTKISSDEYNRIGKILAGYLERQEEQGAEVEEVDLLAWYIEQVE